MPPGWQAGRSWIRRCAVVRALTRATLGWKGKEHQEILMTL